MTDPINHFSDLLDAEETVVSTLAGPGAAVGSRPVWFQMAVTDRRLLVVELRLGVHGAWQPARRESAPLSAVSMARYQRTATTAPRLVVEGLSTAITVVDIDREDVFPMVEPLIVAWGGRLGGTGTERPITRPAVPPPTGVIADAVGRNRRPLAIGVGCVALVLGGFATAGLLGLVLFVIRNTA
ncbi:MAG: hypothetical protein VX944_01535 [Myxococcota bacterium]|nr:hypothetical protein [Myxococcota bacterium]MEC9388732.1 hypothetical protein [Myxococcota bacterium]